MKKFTKIIAFIMVLFTMFSIFPVQTFAAENVTVYVNAYDENGNMIYQKVRTVTKDVYFDATKDMNSVSNMGYVVNGSYSEYSNNTFSNKLSDNKIKVTNDLVVYISAYKDNNDNADSNNVAYSFNIFWDKTQSVSTVGWRYYNLSSEVKNWEEQGYTFVGAFGDRGYTNEIEDITAIDLLAYPDIYIKFRSIHYTCVSSSGVNTYEYTTPFKKNYTLADTQNLIKNYFTNSYEISVDNYSNKEHTAKITDISYFTNYEEDTIPVYSVAYYTNGGPITTKVYTVKFDVNAPEGKKVDNISSVNAERNKVITLKEPKCDGYNFLGWYLNDEKVSNKFTVEKDVTLIAKWSKAEVVKDEDKDTSTKEESTKESASESKKEDTSESKKEESSESKKEDTKKPDQESVKDTNNKITVEIEKDNRIEEKMGIPAWYVIKKVISYKK